MEFLNAGRMFQKVDILNLNLDTNLDFVDKNQESYCCSNMGHRVTRYLDSNYVPFERLKNGSLTFCSRNWFGNIFPISRDQSSQYQILGRKYVSGKRFMSINCIGNVLKSEFRSPFRQKLLNGKEFLDVGRNFSKVNISSLNMNTNFEFL